MTWNMENSYDRSANAMHPPSWPNEMLVKVMSSSHYSEMSEVIDKLSNILEVGIFSGNNSRFLLERGFNLKGSEINLEMIELCRSNLSRLGYPIPEIRIGTNTNLNFQDSEFDLLISINTIHYSAMIESEKAIKEFARVVKVGGWAIIETPASNHFAVRQSIRHDELNWEWRAGGFREGERFGFFDSREHFKKSLLKDFSKVTICYRMEEYGDVSLDFWMAICKK